MEQNKEKRMKRNEDSIRHLWDNIKCTNIRIIGVPEGEERQKGPEKIFEEIRVENFSNMGNKIATQVQEAQRVSGRINPRRNTPRYIVIKLTKIKDKEERDIQDGRRVSCRDHPPPHTYIRNTSTCATAPTEHLLNAGRRPQTCQKAKISPRTRVGKKKKEKTETKE